jgi:hypothetical protein
MPADPGPREPGTPPPAPAGVTLAAPETDGQHPALADTRRWMERAVIGLNLCPFAGPVHLRRGVGFVLSEARDVEALLADLVRELLRLRDADPEVLETTLLVHPHVLPDFADFNDFLDTADAALQALELEGTLQVASFHPGYRFEGTRANDLQNFTNRSPHPTLHLLREASIERALAAFPDPEAAAERIWKRNVKTLQTLGAAGWARLWT